MVPASKQALTQETYAFTVPALADNNVLPENWISSRARWKGRIKWNPLILFQALWAQMWNKTLHT